MPASANQARVQRRVNRASIDIPTPNTSASQQKIREGRAIFALSAFSLPIRTSRPRTSPVCGSSNDTSSTNTRMATTNARAPGSISPATRRSAASSSLR